MDPEEASMKSKCLYEIKIDLALVGNRIQVIFKIPAPLLKQLDGGVDLCFTLL